MTKIKHSFGNAETTSPHIGGLGGLLLLALSLTSCSTDILDAWRQGDGGEVVIKASMSTADDEALATRTNPADDSKESFNVGDKIMVAAGDQTAREYTLAADGKTWTANNTDADGNAIDPLFWLTDPMHFTAYYPVNSTTTATTFTVPKDQSTAEQIAAADWMVCDSTIQRGEGGVASLQLKRKMARITLKIASFSTELNEGTVVKDVTIKSYQVAGSNQYTIRVKPFVQNADANGRGVVGTTYTALIDPTTEPRMGTNSIHFIEITTTDADGTSNKQTIYANLGLNAALEAGKSYSYDVNINKAGVTTVDPTTHTINVGRKNAIKNDTSLITQALNGGTELKIVASNGSNVDGRDFRSIRDYSNNNNITIKKIDISDVPLSLIYGLDNFKTLEEVVLPTTCTVIDVTAFAGSSSLKTINLENVTTVDMNAFNQCTSLTEVDLKNATTLNSQAFLSCTSLTTVDLSSVTSIGAYAFENCSSLTSVKLGQLTTVDHHAFKNCEKLSDIDLNKVTTVGGDAFNGCKGLTSIVSNTITEVGNAAFGNIGDLTEINLPACTKIGDQGVFVKANVSGKVNLPSCTYLGTGAFGTTTLKGGDNLYLPKVKTLGSGAFAYATVEGDIYLPECTSITTDGNSGAFERATVNGDIKFPKCTDIGYRTFYYVTLTGNIYLDALTTFTDQCQAFYYANVSGDVHLPKCININRSTLNSDTKISGKLYLTSKDDITIVTGYYINDMNTPPTLVLNVNKKYGGTGSPTVTEENGKKWNNITWKAIEYEE